MARDKPRWTAEMIWESDGNSIPHDWEPPEDIDPQVAFTRVNKYQQASILELYGQGFKLAVISAVVGVGLLDLVGVLRYHGAGRRETSQMLRFARGTVLNEDMMIKVAEGYRRGAPPSQLRKFFRISNEVMYSILRLYGVEVRKTTLSVETKAIAVPEAIAQYREGVKLLDIFLNTGVVPGLLYAELRKIGYPLRRDIDWFEELASQG